MAKLIHYLSNFGTSSSKSEQSNQRIRFTNTIAQLHLVFICLILILVLYQYGFKVGAQLILLSSAIPIITLLLNQWGKTLISRYWVSYSIPFFIMVISILTKRNNAIGATGFYEFFDTRMLVLVSSLVPLLIFPRKKIKFLFLALLPSAVFLFAYDFIHNLFNVGYAYFFEDTKGGYYIAGLMFNVSYVVAILGILSLKKSNEELVNNNSILINDLNNKNAIQEKLLLKKQELLSQNKEVSESLLTKQQELLKSKEELEKASVLIGIQKNKLEFKNIELTSKVEEKTRALKKANEELIVQNNGLLQFSNTVSHNLRAPVASLLGLIHLFEVEKEESRKQETLAHIKVSSTALDTIISDLNKVVDIRNQLFRLKENVNLSDEIEKLLRASFKDIGAELIVKLKIDNLYFIKSYLHSILYNLISNAMKYSNPANKNMITVASYEANNNVCLEIKDKGLGIDLLKFGNDMFKMHKRFHNHIEGKGMGLYLVKQQVEAMNGKISVKSKPGNGTSFLMEFPVPKEIGFQKYYNTPNATIAYDARSRASILIWKKPPNSKEYAEVLSTNKEMFDNYSANKWLVDIRNLGFVSKKDRTWFASTTLPKIVKKGCKIMVIVKNEGDNKDFAYWQKMLEAMDNKGVLFKIFYDYDLAVEFLQESKPLSDNND